MGLIAVAAGCCNDGPGTWSAPQVTATLMFCLAGAVLSASLPQWHGAVGDGARPAPQTLASPTLLPGATRQP